MADRQLLHHHVKLTSGEWRVYATHRDLTNDKRAGLKTVAEMECAWRDCPREGPKPERGAVICRGTIW